MIITKMALPRRTFLRGMGVTLALPFLDAMVPALDRHRQGGRTGPPARIRLRPQRGGDDALAADAATAR